MQEKLKETDLERAIADRLEELIRVPDEQASHSVLQSVKQYLEQIPENDRPSRVVRNYRSLEGIVFGEKALEAA